MFSRKKSNKKVEQELLSMLNNKYNRNKCGECRATNPTWASWNLGIFLCGRCASLHRRLGLEYSMVKLLTLDEWPVDELERLGSIGNKRAYDTWNPKGEPFPFDEDDTLLLETYLRDKYVKGAFRYDAISKRDYGLDGLYGSQSLLDSYRSQAGSRAGSRTGSVVYEGGSDRESRDRVSRARSTSYSLPRLTHSATLSEYQRQKCYQNVLKLKREHGVTAPDDDIYEALHLAKNKVSLALEILAESGPKPKLPQRPGAASVPASSPSTSQNGTPGPVAYAANNPMLGARGATSGGSEWWSLPSATAASEIPDNLQPFLDPASGAVVYVDSVTGQQYMDPNQGPTQIQGIQAFQTGATSAGFGNGMPSQATGVDKQSILSLYNQPTGQPRLGQTAQQQPAQAGYQQPFQQPVQTGFQQPFQQPVQAGYQQPFQQPVQTGYQQPFQQPVQTGYQQPFQQSAPTGGQQQFQAYQQPGWQ